MQYIITRKECRRWNFSIEIIGIEETQIEATIVVDKSKASGRDSYSGISVSYKILPVGQFPVEVLKFEE